MSSVIWCPNCEAETLALPNGTCSWCSPEIVLTEKRVPDGECRQCGKPFSYHPLSRGKIYCSKRCHNAHWDQSANGLARRRARYEVNRAA